MITLPLNASSIVIESVNGMTNFSHITDTVADRSDNLSETSTSDKRIEVFVPQYNVKAHFYEDKCNDPGCPDYGENVVWQTWYWKGRSAR